MQPSPYTPGEVAREVPGRTQQLAEIDERLMYMTSLGRLVGRIRVDTGPRGLGKTSLLREAQRHAEGRDALVVWVTAGSEGGLVAGIAAALEEATGSWGRETRGRLRRAMDELKVKVGVPGVAGVEATLSAEKSPPNGVPAGEREFERLVRETCTAAAAEGRRGLVIFVDEIQAGDTHGLRTLAYAWQHLQAEGPDVPAAVFGAGLPESPEVIGEAATFSERFRYRPLERLDPGAEAIALVRPAALLDVGWDDAALRRVLEQTQGYPYTLQLYGDAVWRAAGNPDGGARLTTGDVDAARVEVEMDLLGLFRARWVKSTRLERRFMTAMAHAGGDGPVPRAEVAARLGVTSDELGVPRARLIDKGFIAPAGHGRVEFTVPGFAAFVRDQEDSDPGQ